MQKDGRIDPSACPLTLLHFPQMRGLNCGNGDRARPGCPLRVKGRRGRQADGRAGLPPASEMAGAFRHLRFVPRTAQGCAVAGDPRRSISASRARALIDYRCCMGFRIAGDRQAIQSGFQSDRVWANDQLCRAPPPQMQEMNPAIRGANPVCS
jgi:hypothetical protein